MVRLHGQSPRRDHGGYVSRTIGTCRWHPRGMSGWCEGVSQDWRRCLKRHWRSTGPGYLDPVQTLEVPCGMGHAAICHIGIVSRDSATYPCTSGKCTAPSSEGFKGACSSLWTCFHAVISPLAAHMRIMPFMQVWKHLGFMRSMLTH